MLDIHTHILPRMDDGSKSIRQSMEMLGREARQGIDRLVLTPHFYAQREAPETFLKRRAQSVRMLEKAAADKELPRRYVGAEVAFFNGMSRTEQIDQFCIGDTRAMLVEMPFGRWNENILEELEYLNHCRGIRPIVAHVERYMQYQPMGTIRRLNEAGVWIQCNAMFFLRWQSSWMALKMLKERHIHFIGSDCHDTERRPPNLGEALEKIEQHLGQREIWRLEEMASLLLEGE